MNHLVPVIPESAPFTPDQRAYLNGFFAGLFSRAPVAGGATAPLPDGRPLLPLSILFGSQTGNCERLAKRIANEAGRHGFAPTIHDLAKYPTAQLSSESRVLIVTSTYGDGEPPDNAKEFWKFLASDAAPRLPNLRFSLCALGDTNYVKFCGFGKDLDARLAELGATCVHPRADSDVDYEVTFAKWLGVVVTAMGVPANASISLEKSCDHAEAVRGAACPTEASTFSRLNPFPGRLLVNRKLNAPGSGKEVRHFEIALAGSGLAYEAGDALGVVPQNDPKLVAELLAALGASGEEIVPGKTGSDVWLREALTSHCEITRIPKPLLEVFAMRTGDELLKRVSAPEANGELTKFLWGRQVIDLLLAHPQVTFSPNEFVALLRRIQARLYSISSSPKAHPGEAHLTVSAVRYECFSRARAGVCSTFLADRVTAETTVPVFVHTNSAFRPPAPDVPLLMVGPGTGIAPFRAFLEERRASCAKGKNWLFFGDQKSSLDFLYREEIELFQKDGVLTRLDLAWSRDQAEKIYVQHRMLEHAKELFEWLESGASFFVCGDANRMAKDVDAALHKVIEIGSGRSPNQADDYVGRLKAAQRYQRDVY